MPQIVNLKPVTDPNMVPQTIEELGLNPTDPMVEDMFWQFNGWGLAGILVAFRATRHYLRQFSCTFHEALDHVADIVSGEAHPFSIHLFRGLLTDCNYNQFVIGDPEISDILAATKQVIERYETIVMAMVVHRQSNTARA